MRRSGILNSIGAGQSTYNGMAQIMPIALLTHGLASEAALHGFASYRRVGLTMGLCEQEVT